MLAAGESLQSLSFSYRIGHSTACEIAAEVSLVLYQVLAPEYLKVPDKTGWLQIAKEFDHLWDFPHCLGALDGKHVRISAPANTGSEYFNYKSYFR